MKFRAQRYPTRYPVSLKVGVVEYMSLVTSVSGGGMCLTVDELVPVGEAVTMECQVGRFKGEVRWAVDDKIGVKFVHPISKGLLDRIRYGMQVSEGMRRPKVGLAELG